MKTRKIIIMKTCQMSKFTGPVTSTRGLAARGQSTDDDLNDFNIYSSFNTEARAKL